MTARTHSSSATLRTQQRGYALIGIIAAVGIPATTLLVTSLSTTALRNEQDRKSGYALAQAKQALIGPLLSAAWPPVALLMNAWCRSCRPKFLL